MFKFDPPANAVAAEFLTRAAAYLEPLSAAQQTAWLSDWTPRMREAPLSKGMTEFDRHLVVIALEDWAKEIKLRLARAA